MQDSTPRPQWLDKELYPFRNHNQLLEIDGNRIHYVDEAHRPVLLLLHGNPTWSFLYRQIISRLLSQFRCAAVDYPGFGLSFARHGYSFKPREHSSTLE